MCKVRGKSVKLSSMGVRLLESHVSDENTTHKHNLETYKKSFAKSRTFFGTQKSLDNDCNAASSSSHVGTSLSNYFQIPLWQKSFPSEEQNMDISTTCRKRLSIRSEQIYRVSFNETVMVSVLMGGGGGGGGGTALLKK